MWSGSDPASYGAANIGSSGTGGSASLCKRGWDSTRGGGVSSSTRIIQKPKWRNEDRHGGGGVVDVRWDGSLRSGLPPSKDLLPPPPAGLRPKACDRGVEFREVHAGLRVLVLQGLQHHLDLVDVLQEPRLLRLPGLVFPPQLANFQCRLASFLERVQTRARKK